MRTKYFQKFIFQFLETAGYNIKEIQTWSTTGLVPEYSLSTENLAGFGQIVNTASPKLTRKSIYNLPDTVNIQ